jgi:hypothetical protein
MKTITSRNRELKLSGGQKANPFRVSHHECEVQLPWNQPRTNQNLGIGKRDILFFGRIHFIGFPLRNIKQ